VAIRSTGGLELAPTFKSLYATPSNLHLGHSGRQERATCMWRRARPPGVIGSPQRAKASIISSRKNSRCKPCKFGSGGVIFAATAPDGKVYKIENKPGGKTPAKADTPQPAPSDKDKDKDATRPSIDASWSSSVYFEPGTKYIWDLALDKSGNLYVATGDHGGNFRVTPRGEHSVFFKSDETHIRVLAFDAQDNLIAGSDGNG